MKALIVEDSPVIQESLRHYLRGSGLEADYASDAEEALDRLPYCLPDVLVLDHYLPGMDGLEMLHVLRGKGRWKSLPVVLFTAAAPAEAARLEGLLPALQPARLLRKPSEPAVILRAIEEMKGGGE